MNIAILLAGLDQPLLLTVIAARDVGPEDVLAGGDSDPHENDARAEHLPSGGASGRPR
jgi:hypothetical protein